MNTETCQRLASAFQNHFSLESPVLAAKQQKILDFNLSLRRLMNEATLRLHQTSLELKDGTLESVTNELQVADHLVLRKFQLIIEFIQKESKESLQTHLATTHHAAAICALLEYLSRLYKEIEKLQQEPINSFDSLTLQFGSASYIYEAMSCLLNDVQKGTY